MENYKPHPRFQNYVHVDGVNIKRHIVCAANRRVSDGLIICGARHWDHIMHAVADAAEVTSKHSFEWEQGFIDQYGHFVTREDAAVIVEANNQTLRSKPDYKLYSEDLY